MLEECYNFAGDVRINRYIVGCKFDNIKNYLDKAGGINRYIVGCKYVPDMKIYSEDD